MTAVKRLVPKPDTLRALYLMSGNVCAFGGCTTVMINRDGTMIGEVCHIEAAEENGPRFNKNMTNETRRQQSNLYLLCPTHHTLVDKDTKTYTVGKLKAMKRSHEAAFQEIDQTLRQAFEKQFEDHTDAITPFQPTAFSEIISAGFAEFEGGELQRTLREFERYTERLRNVPDKERNFMLSVLKRAHKLGRIRNVVELHTDDVKSAFRIGHTTIKTLANSLDRHGVGCLSDHGQNGWYVEIHDPSDYLGWSQIMDFGEKKGIPLERFIIDLKFELLG